LNFLLGNGEQISDGLLGFDFDFLDFLLVRFQQSRLLLSGEFSELGNG
jgi:hypothetical protein